MTEKELVQAEIERLKVQLDEAKARLKEIGRTRKVYCIAGDKFVKWYNTPEKDRKPLHTIGFEFPLEGLVYDKTSLRNMNSNYVHGGDWVLVYA